MKSCFSFACLLACLALFAQSTSACLVAYFTKDLPGNWIQGKLFDNGVEICSINASGDDIHARDVWWNCQQGHFVWMNNEIVSHVGGRTGWTDTQLRKEMRYLRKGGNFRFSLYTFASGQGNQIFYYGNHYGCECRGWMCGGRFQKREEVSANAPGTFVQGPADFFDDEKNILLFVNETSPDAFLKEIAPGVWWNETSADLASAVVNETSSDLASLSENRTNADLDARLHHSGTSDDAATAPGRRNVTRSRIAGAVTGGRVAPGTVGTN